MSMSSCIAERFVNDKPRFNWSEETKKATMADCTTERHYIVGVVTRDGYFNTAPMTLKEANFEFEVQLMQPLEPNEPNLLVEVIDLYRNRTIKLR